MDRSSAFSIRRQRLRRLRLWRRGGPDDRRRGRRWCVDIWRTGRRTFRRSVVYRSPSSVSQRQLVSSSQHSDALSCIGVRRLCLRDSSCRRLLHEFTKYCVENTNIHQCVTTQWFVVYRLKVRSQEPCSRSVFTARGHGPWTRLVWTDLNR